MCSLVRTAEIAVKEWFIQKQSDPIYKGDVVNTHTQHALPFFPTRLAVVLRVLSHGLYQRSLSTQECAQDGMIFPCRAAGMASIINPLENSRWGNSYLQKPQQTLTDMLFIGPRYIWAWNPLKGIESLFLLMRTARFSLTLASRIGPLQGIGALFVYSLF